MNPQVDEKEMIDKVRAAIKDRATWFALLYRTFKETFPEQEVERLSRKAIFEFGRMKAKKDPADFSPRAWVERHVAKGSSLVFDSDVEINETGAVQRMKFCALVEAWKEMAAHPRRSTSSATSPWRGTEAAPTPMGFAWSWKSASGVGISFVI